MIRSDMTHTDSPPSDRGFQFSLRETLGLVTIAVLVAGLITATKRLRSAERERDLLRNEVGYLTPTDADQIAASRAPSDQPLTYRVRVRVPEAKTKFRLAYSSIWPAGESSPMWFSAVPIVAGESLVTVRIMEDPRDGRWKISTIVGTSSGTRRMATTLPPDQVPVFRGSHEVLSTGIPRGETFAAAISESIRVLDERWLVGEGSLLLYGDRPPDADQLGIFAELQPDTGPL
ncbi:hypothetical protein Poly51_33540 [Rubripirellula tenax]|uniref:Uncharacterized protein n=1 Tax=Rubripirellula tenax TaxID=2528015 RepID=A0A5C6F0S9_9BACT|nr:hypothetical protein [Rubripirellula tenax]TWU54635.1 hypothetical protein Poly51_33540 [Rubripirellula tenax]